MAEAAKKESKGTKRYGHGPKIEPKEGAGHEPAGGGAPEGTKKEAEKTAGDPEPQASAKKDEGPSGTETAGTDHISVRHGKEMKEMHGRHGQEMADMHERHQAEHKKMGKRHIDEMTAEVGEGKGGTEPA